jgi:hypothetical protein
VVIKSDGLHRSNLPRLPVIGDDGHGSTFSMLSKQRRGRDLVWARHATCFTYFIFVVSEG